MRIVKEINKSICQDCSIRLDKMEGTSINANNYKRSKPKNLWQQAPIRGGI